MDKRIVILLVIIAILAGLLCYGIFTHQEPAKKIVNNTTAPTNNTTVKNATLEETTTESSSDDGGEYGYCAICGKALTYAEANSEYTQGKVCHSCAANPDYQSEEGAKYANEKLYEAYPDEYAWMHEDSNDHSKNSKNGEDSN